MRQRFLVTSALLGALSLCALGCGGKSGSSGGNEGGDGNAGGAPACADFSDDDGWSVAVEIANDSSRPLHVGQTMSTCNIEPLFQVADEAGNALPSLGMCRTPCEALIDGQVPGCPAICALPTAFTLEPGESTNQGWSGLYKVDETLPAACVPASVGGLDSCDRAVEINPGSFTFTARAGTELDCSQGAGTCSQCQPTNVGGCATPGALIAGELVTASATVDLDASYGVGGPGGTGGATLPVRIVFKD